jgi:hypothetical protein
MTHRQTATPTPKARARTSSFITSPTYSSALRVYIYPSVDRNILRWIRIVRRVPVQVLPNGR